MDLEDAIKEAYECAPAAGTYFDTLEIICSAFDESIKVVNGYRGIETADGSFIAVLFDFTLPETEGSVRGEMTVSVNGVPLAAREQIRLGVQSVYPVTVKYRQYYKETAEDPTAGTWEADAQWPIPLSVIEIKETRNGIEASCMCTDLVGMYFPRRLMSIEQFPGLRS